MAARPHWKLTRSSTGSPARRQPLFCRGGPVKSTPPTSLQDTTQGQSQYSSRRIQSSRVALIMRVVTGAAFAPSRHGTCSLSPSAPALRPYCPLSSARAVSVPSAMMAPSTCSAGIQQDYYYYMGQPAFWISGKPAILRRNRTKEEGQSPT